MTSKNSDPCLTVEVLFVGGATKRYSLECADDTAPQALIDNLYQLQAISGIDLKTGHNFRVLLAQVVCVEAWIAKEPS